MPEPSGLGAAFAAAQNANAFRDMAGLAGTQENTIAGLQVSADLAKSFGMMAAENTRAQVAADAKAGSNLKSMMDALDKGVDKGLISKEDAKSSAQAMAARLTEGKDEAELKHQREIEKEAIGGSGGAEITRTNPGGSHSVKKNPDPPSWDPDYVLASDDASGEQREQSCLICRDDWLLILEHVADSESRRDYGALNRDTEYVRRANDPEFTGDNYHIGLSYGYVQFTQDSGMLGRLLERMRQKDPETFSEVFGPRSDDLVALTTASGSNSYERPPRGVRVQPMWDTTDVPADGAGAAQDLWEEPWTTRFTRAAEHEPFREAQLELACETYINPMMTFAALLGEYTA